MNCLAVIAELKKCSVAVSYNGRVFEVNENEDSSSHLAWLTDQLLKQHNIKFREINKIVTISGPGSFTGIRVAQSLCKGLALALDIPVTCMNYFNLLLCMFYDKINNRDTLILIKSKKNQYYYSYDGRVEVASKSDFINLIRKDIVLIGEDVSEVIELIKDYLIDYYETSDFRQAKNLLKYVNFAIDHVSPLYINAQTHSS